MSTLTADDTLKALLVQVRETTRILDANGEVLGYFTPRLQAEAELDERAKTLFDPVEMERRAATEHGQGATIEEVMRRLQSLETPG